MSTAAAIGTAYVDIQPDWSGFSKRLPASVNSKLAGYNKSLTGATTTTGKLSSTTQRLGSRLSSAARFAAGAAAAYVGISQAKAAITTTQELATTSGLLARNLGLTTKEASRWASVAQTRDISTKQLNASFGTLTTKLTDARQGVEAAEKTFASLGITQEDLAATGGDFQKQILLVADAFGETEGGAERQAAAQDLLGRGYQTLLPLMSQGSDALREQLELGDKYGATMGKKAVAAQQHLTAELRESERAWQGLQVQFTTAVTPALETVNRQFQKIAEINADPRLTSDEKWSRISAIIEKDFSRALDVVVKLIPETAERVGEAAPQIAGALVKGFLNADAWGKLAIGAFLVTKLGGWGAITAIGTLIGRRAGAGVATGMAASGVAAGAGGAGAARQAPKWLEKVLGGGGAGAAGGAAGGTSTGRLLLKRLGPPAAAAAVVDHFWKEVSDVAEEVPLFGDLGGFHGEKVKEELKESLEALQPLIDKVTERPTLGRMARLAEAMQRIGQKAREAGVEVPDVVQRFERFGRSMGFLATRVLGGGKALRGLEGVLKGLSTKEPQDAISGLQRKYGSLIVAGHQMSRKQRDAFENMMRAARENGDITQNQLERVTNAFDSNSSKWERMMSRAARATGQSTRSMKKSVGDMTVRVSKDYEGMVRVTGGGLDLLTANTSRAMKALGITKEIKFRASAPKTIGAHGLQGSHARQRGGMVPGTGVGDKIHAQLPIGSGIVNRKAADVLLEPRELALMPEIVRKIGGPEVIERINQVIPRFQRGGMVDPAGPGTGVVNAAIAKVVGNWSRKYDAAINYGYDPGGGHVSPGHNVTGTATDTSPAAGWGAGPTRLFESGLRKLVSTGLQVLYGSHGVGTPFPNHGFANHAHIEWGMSPNVKGVAAAERIKRVILEGPDGPLKDMGQAALDKTWKAANRFLAKQAPAAGSLAGEPGPKGTLSKSQIAGVWRQANRRQGDPNLMAAIALAESSGNPRAVGHDPGGTTGLGLWQITTGFNDDLIARYGGRRGMFDPISNAKAAGDILERQGPGAWVVYNSGAYRQHLKQGGLVRRGGGRDDERDERGPRGLGLERIKDIRQRLGKQVRTVLPKLDEGIDISERRAGLTTSPGGSELALSEITQQVGLQQKLLDSLQKTLHVAKRGMRIVERTIRRIEDDVKQLERKIKAEQKRMERKIEKANAFIEAERKKDEPDKKKIAGAEDEIKKSKERHGKPIDRWQDDLKKRKAALERLPTWRQGFRDTITEMSGVTGGGGRIFDTKLVLKELKASQTPQALHIGELLEFAEAMRFGAFKRPSDTVGPLPTFARGGTIAGSRPKGLRRGPAGDSLPGSVRVPGIGSGDKVHAKLPFGSVVVNREAADVLLEPRERVFLPDEVREMGGPERVNRLNKLFPRFQGGGVVDRAATVPTDSRVAPSTAPGRPEFHFEIRTFIGDREVTDIVRQEIREKDRKDADRWKAGARR